MQTTIQTVEFTAFSMIEEATDQEVSFLVTGPGTPEAAKELGLYMYEFVAHVDLDPVAASYPNENGGGAYSGGLHVLDYGAHVPLLEEWNDSSTFDWGTGHVDFPEENVARVHHAFTVNGMTATAKAHYRADGEGDLLDLTVFDKNGVHVLRERGFPAPEEWGADDDDELEEAEERYFARLDDGDEGNALEHGAGGGDPDEGWL